MGLAIALVIFALAMARLGAVTDPDVGTATGTALVARTLGEGATGTSRPTEHVRLRRSSPALSRPVRRESQDGGGQSF